MSKEEPNAPADVAVRLLSTGQIPEWNEWRRTAQCGIDLSGCKFVGRNLSGANLADAVLRGIDLSESQLRQVDFARSDLTHAVLRRAEMYGTSFNEARCEHADFSRARMGRVDFMGTRLKSAQFRAAVFLSCRFTASMLDLASCNGARLSGVTFRMCSLRETGMVGAMLKDVDFVACDMASALFQSAVVSEVRWMELDLGPVEGLESVIHVGGSAVDLGTVLRSGSKVPLCFYEGARLPKSFLRFLPSLIGAPKPVEFYTTFLSYAKPDEAFAQRLYADLAANNVTAWYAPEHLRIGARIRDEIEGAIRVSDKLTIVLSQHSIASSWVESEVESAIEKERKTGATVLFPITLDDAIDNTDRAWATHIRVTRHIGDFRRWTNHDDYGRSFRRLLRDLSIVRTAKPTDDSDPQ